MKTQAETGVTRTPIKGPWSPQELGETARTLPRGAQPSDLGLRLLDSRLRGELLLTRTAQFGVFCDSSQGHMWEGPSSAQAGPDPRPTPWEPLAGSSQGPGRSRTRLTHVVTLGFQSPQEVCGMQQRRVPRVCRGHQVPAWAQQGPWPGGFLGHQGCRPLGVRKGSQHTLISSGIPLPCLPGPSKGQRVRGQC